MDVLNITSIIVVLEGFEILYNGKKDFLSTGPLMFPLPHDSEYYFLKFAITHHKYVSFAFHINNSYIPYYSSH